MSRQKARMSLEFEVSFDHKAPESQRMPAAIKINADLAAFLKAACDLGRSDLVLTPVHQRVAWVTTDPEWEKKNAGLDSSMDVG